MIIRCFIWLLLAWGLCAAPWQVAHATEDSVVDIWRVSICEVSSTNEQSQCRDGTLADVDPQSREMWIEARVNLGGLNVARPLGVFLTAMASAELWWDGQLIGQNGRPGRTRDQEVVGKFEFTAFIPPPLTGAGEHVLRIRMSSHHLGARVGRPVHQIAIRPWGEPHLVRLPEYLPALLLASLFAIAALYFGLLFIMLPRDRSALYLALVALFALGQVIAESWRALVPYDYPFHLVRLNVVHVFAVMFSFALTAYATQRFAPRRQILILCVTLIAIAAGSLLVESYDGRTWIALLSAAVATAAACSIGVYEGRHGARFALGLVVSFAAIAVLDPGGTLDRNLYFALGFLFLLLFGQHVHTFHTERELRAGAENRASRLELELLKKQISPHYFLNTMNALLEWVESEPTTAARMIGAVGREFRLLSEISGQTLIPLETELELCRTHLSLMSFRQDRTWSLKENIANNSAQIPPGVLHSLVENAVKHRQSDGPCEVTITQTVEGKATHYQVTSLTSDNPATAADRIGTGHAYVRARLREAFGERWSFQSSKTAGAWVDSLSIHA